MERTKKQQTRKRIEQAALKLFRDKGYSQTTVKEITQAAGIAKGTFFNHFPTKESIMHSLAKERIQAAPIHLEQTPFCQLPLVLRIRSYLDFILSDYT